MVGFKITILRPKKNKHLFQESMQVGDPYGNSSTLPCKANFFQEDPIALEHSNI